MVLLKPIFMKQVYTEQQLKHEASAHKITTKRNLYRWIDSLPYSVTERRIERLIREIEESEYQYVIWHGWMEFEVW